MSGATQVALAAGTVIFAGLITVATTVEQRRELARHRQAARDARRRRLVPGIDLNDALIQRERNRQAERERQRRAENAQRSPRNRPQNPGKNCPTAVSVAYFEMRRAAVSAAMLMVDDDTREKLIFGLNMIRGRVLANHMTQERLGKIVGVDRRQIMRWEHGEYEPRPPMRKRIARALDQPLPFFYDETVLEDNDRR